MNFLVVPAWLRPVANAVPQHYCTPLARALLGPQAPTATSSWTCSSPWWSPPCYNPSASSATPQRPSAPTVWWVFA